MVIKKNTLYVTVIVLIALLFLLASCSPVLNGSSSSKQTYHLTIEYGEGGADSAQVKDLMDGDYEEGVRIGIGVIPQSMSGYHFIKWTSSNGGAFVNENSETYFIMPGNDTVMTANFAQSEQ